MRFSWKFGLLMLTMSWMQAGLERLFGASNALTEHGGTCTLLACLSLPSSPSPAIPKGSHWQREAFSLGGNGDRAAALPQLSQGRVSLGGTRELEVGRPSPGCSGRTLPNHPGLPSSPSLSPRHLLPCSHTFPRAEGWQPSPPPATASVTSDQVPARINITDALPETAPERGDSQGENGA